MRAMGRGPMGPGMGLPAERSKDLRGTLRKLLARLRPERIKLVIAVGLAIGLPSGLGMARLIQSQLYNVSPADPFALAGAALSITAVVLLAGLLPARRATRIDPAAALRWE